MNINEMIIKFKNRFGKQDLEKLAEEGAEKVQAALEEFENSENIDEVKVATEAAIEAMKEHPEPKLAVKMIENINETVSSTVAVNAVIQLTEEEEFSEKTAVQAAKQLELKDEHIITIIEEGGFGYKNKMEIAEQLEDDETRDKIQQDLKNEEEQRCLKQLHKIYLLCNEDMNELKLEKQLNEVMKNMTIHTDDIQEKINRIIARLIAFNYARYGSNIVSKQKSLMPANKMREINIVQMAKEEYKKIVGEHETIKGYKIKEFDEERLRDAISVEIEAAARTDEFNEENAFEEIKSLMNVFMRYDERKETLIALQEEIEDEKIRKIYKKIRELGIVDKLAELPENESEKVLETLGNVLDKRKNKEHRLKVAEETPRIKSYEFTTKAKKSDEERE